MRNAVDLKVCVALIRSELAGYQGYPHSVLGEERFARALQDVSASVDHARAILSRFTEDFPTVQKISDVGLDLLPQFEIKASQYQEWEREYGRPAPIKPNFSNPNEPYYVERDRLVKAFLTKKHGHFPGFHKIEWQEILEAQTAVAAGGAPADGWTDPDR